MIFFLPDSSYQDQILITACLFVLWCFLLTFQYPVMQYQSDWISIFSLWDYTRNLGCLTDVCIRLPDIQCSHKMNNKYIILKRQRRKPLWKCFFVICRSVQRARKVYLKQAIPRKRNVAGHLNVHGFSAGLCNVLVMRCADVTFYFSFVPLIW